VANWNLAYRPISITSDGEALAGSEVLRTYWFAEANSPTDPMLEQASYGRSEVFELLKWYESRLACNTDAAVPAGWWHYGHYEDQTPIPPHHRLIWRERQDLRQTFEDPFESGADTFQSWCDMNIGARERLFGSRAPAHGPL
jgi:hypothetical protein